MSKKLRVSLLLSGLSLTAGLLAWFFWPRPSNVVLVVIDTVRSDHLATYGYGRDTAPFLDRLAREGAVFEGLSPSSWTKPATASLLTGLHPLRHQAVGRLDGLPDQAVTLAELLRAEGYRTLAVSSNGWISAPFGFGQGFDELILQDSIGHAEDLNRALAPRLDRLEPPYFLYVHYIDPHAPYEPRTAWDGGPPPPGGPIDIESLDPFTVRQRPAELLARVRDLYDGEIRGADRGLEQLVGELGKRKLLDNTILVVTSDHGEEIEDHGRMSHGLSLYEEVVRVPLVFHAPHRVPAGRHGLASLLDVVPTLMEILDLGDGSADLDGISLAGRLRGGEPSGPRGHLFHLDHMDGTSLALSDGREKILLGRRPYAKALFAPAADPGERRNLLDQGGEEDFARLAAELAARYNDFGQRALPRREARLNDELSKKLAALGYAAPGRTGDPRRIPRRIVPADSISGGLLGWEGANELASCFELSGPEAERQLLRGWYTADPAGRWSKQEGAIVLKAPPKGSRSTLVVEGVSYRLDTPRVTMRAARRQLLEVPVPPGAFHLTAAVDQAPENGPLLVEIATDRAFVPSEHGMADSRPLGLFVSTACLQTE